MTSNSGWNDCRRPTMTVFDVFSYRPPAGRDPGSTNRTGRCRRPRPTFASEAPRLHMGTKGSEPDKDFRVYSGSIGRIDSCTHGGLCGLGYPGGQR